VDDINIMFKNCYTYNKPEEDVCLMASSLEKFFLLKLKSMPPVEVELTQDIMRKGGMSQGSAKGPNRPKKVLGGGGSMSHHGPDLGDSDSMHSVASDPLEIKTPIKAPVSSLTPAVNSQSSGTLNLKTHALNSEHLITQLLYPTEYRTAGGIRIQSYAGPDHLISGQKIQTLV
jgi:hypothetical protein